MTASLLFILKFSLDHSGKNCLRATDSTNPAPQSSNSEFTLCGWSQSIASVPTTSRDLKKNNTLFGVLISNVVVSLYVLLPRRDMRDEKSAVPSSLPMITSFTNPTKMPEATTP